MNEDPNFTSLITTPKIPSTMPVNSSSSTMILGSSQQHQSPHQVVSGGSGQPAPPPPPPSQLDATIAALDSLNDDDDDEDDFDEFSKAKSAGPRAQKPASAKSKSNNKASKVYDPDKHCGVVTEKVDPLTGLKTYTEPCTRSLTCKKHSINLRRQVQGRSKAFNELFKQYRDEKLHCHASNSSEHDAAASRPASATTTTTSTATNPTINTTTTTTTTTVTISGDLCGLVNGHHDDSPDGKTPRKRASCKKTRKRSKKDAVAPEHSFQDDLHHPTPPSGLVDFDGRHVAMLDQNHHQHHQLVLGPPHHGQMPPMNGYKNEPDVMMVDMMPMLGVVEHKSTGFISSSDLGGLSCDVDIDDCFHHSSGGGGGGKHHAAPVDYNNNNSSLPHSVVKHNSYVGSPPIALLTAQPPQHAGQYIGQQSPPQPPPRLTLNNSDSLIVKHHPRPSAVTSYNARLTNGGGYAVWNRQQDNLRYVLSNAFGNLNENETNENAATTDYAAGKNGGGDGGVFYNGYGTRYVLDSVSGNAEPQTIYSNSGSSSCGGGGGNGGLMAQQHSTSNYNYSVSSVGSYCQSSNPTLSSSGYNNYNNDNQLNYQYQSTAHQRPLANHSPMYAQQLSMAAASGGPRGSFDSGKMMNGESLEAAYTDSPGAASLEHTNNSFKTLSFAPTQPVQHRIVRLQLGQQEPVGYSHHVPAAPSSSVLYSIPSSAPFVEKVAHPAGVQALPAIHPKTSVETFGLDQAQQQPPSDCAAKPASKPKTPRKRNSGVEKSDLNEAKTNQANQASAAKKPAKSAAKRAQSVGREVEMADVVVQDPSAADSTSANNKKAATPKKTKARNPSRTKKQAEIQPQMPYFPDSVPHHSPPHNIPIMPNSLVASAAGKQVKTMSNNNYNQHVMMMKSASVNEFSFFNNEMIDPNMNDVNMAMQGHQMLPASGGGGAVGGQQLGKMMPAGGGTMDDFDNFDFDNIANFFDSGQQQQQSQQQHGQRHVMMDDGMAGNHFGGMQANSMISMPTSDSQHELYAAAPNNSMNSGGGGGGQVFSFGKTSSSFINDGSGLSGAANPPSNPNMHSYLSEMAAIDGIKNQIKRAYLSSSSSPSSNSINSMPPQQQQHQQQMMMSQAQHHQHQQPHMQQTQPGHYHQVHSNAATGSVYGGGGHLQATQTAAQTNSSSSYSIDDDLLFEQFSGDYYNPIGMFSTSGGGGAKMNASSSSTSISNMGSNMHLGGGGGVGVSGGMNSMINSYNGVVPSMREPLKSASSISLSPSPSSSSSSSSSSMPLGGGGNGVVVGGSLVNSTTI